MGGGASSAPAQKPLSLPPGLSVDAIIQSRSSMSSSDIEEAIASQQTANYYQDLDVLLDAVRRNEVRLVRGSFLVEWFQRGRGPILRRQAMPEEAFVPIEQISTAPGDLELVAISYCWLDRDHPDPHGFHLAAVANMLRAFMAGRYNPASYDGHVQKHMQEMKQVGYDFGAGDSVEVGVFWDFLSLPQVPRRDDEEELFRRALRHINVWYGHERITKWIFPSMPGHRHRPPYERSGWCCFEREVANLITPPWRVLHLSQEITSRLSEVKVFMEHDYLRIAERASESIKRTAPKTPEEFEEMIESCVFADHNEKGKLIIPKYKQAFDALMAQASTLSFRYFNLSSVEAERALRIIGRRCKVLQSLDFSDNHRCALKLDAWAHCLQGCNRLQELALSRCWWVSGDLLHIGSLVTLRELCLSNTKVTGDLSGLAPLTFLSRLSLQGVSIAGNVSGLSLMKSLEKVDLRCCHRVVGDVHALTPLHNLKELDLAVTKVTGSLSSFAQIPNLERLVLKGTNVSGNLSGISDLINLVELDLGLCYKVAGNLRSLTHMRRMKELDLESTMVSGDVCELVGLSRLRRLVLKATNVSGEVCGLELLTNMQHLDISHCKMVSGDVVRVVRSNTALRIPNGSRSDVGSRSPSRSRELGSRSTSRDTGSNSRDMKMTGSASQLRLTRDLSRSRSGGNSSEMNASFRRRKQRPTE